MPRFFAATWVLKCMAVELYQRKNGLVRFGLLLHPGESAVSDFLVDGFHALLGQRAGVLDRLAALAVGDLQCSTPRGPNSFLNAGSLG